jgi:hypothetical protein
MWIIKIVQNFDNLFACITLCMNINHTSLNFYIVINVYRSGFGAFFWPKFNQLNGLKAQIRFSSKKLISFNAQFKNNDDSLLITLPNLKDVLWLYR